VSDRSPPSTNCNTSRIQLPVSSPTRAPETTSPQSFKSSTGSPYSTETSSRFSSSHTKPLTSSALHTFLTSCTNTLPPATSNLQTATSLPPVLSKHRTWGYRAFSPAAPSYWNSLPHHLRHSPSLATFKAALKTNLFKSAFSP